MRDPFLLLGVGRDADDDAVRAAFLAAIRDCPPDRDPQRYESLRQAYARIATRRDRLAFELLDRELPEPLDILDRGAPLNGSCRPDPGVLRALLRGDR